MRIRSCGLIAVVLALAPGSAFGDWYFLTDYQYFRPMIADIRTTNNHTRYIYDEALPYTDDTDPDSRHLQWDVGFSEYFPMLGFEWGDNTDRGPLQRMGATLFVDGGAHMLLDFNAPSAAVINTDFRAGVGVAMRFPDPADWVSLRAHFFHESTHLGDEYILLGVDEPGFRRYNPSYEALSLHLSGDRFAKWGTDFRLPPIRNPFTGRKSRIPLVGRQLTYARGYAGIRGINNDSYSGYNNRFEKREPLRATGDPEIQLGGELFYRGWKPADQRDTNFFKEWLQWQNVVVALEFYRRDQYSPTKPEISWSKNLVVGLVYGDHFGTESEPTMKWLLNFYDGVHPHGQLRSRKMEYIGFDIVIDF
ncbi:MAG: DUF1207 domain-containing protein [Gemmatimonadetes bacterium]|nr:DUF1207 domain-containing protein [Gemmatimonadota bacterium]MBT4609559.1 DUF1207 domain-containing protein [Gemmatimonadota bacterium]MBT5058177.1 DUF1207 domain-containing protein [Gemmatimonadota bacterium]MBT5142716.1 DUF1207 domain-containing protein [Gemmatimonadota bacterium]MBT5587692.1 DUF1207 domain-containing protein [Gemmatimonadota bacterium]